MIPQPKQYYKDVPDVTAQLVQTLADGQVNPYSDGRNDSIQIGSGNTVFNVNPSGMWMGHARYALAPFRANMNGEVWIKILNALGVTLLDDTGLVSAANFPAIDAIATGDQTITGTSWADVTTLTHTIVTTRAANVLLYATLCGYHNDTDQRLDFQFLLNGSAVGPIFCTNRVAAASVIQSSSAMYVASLIEGTNVVKIQARSSNANAGVIKGTVLNSYFSYMLLGK